MRDDIDSALQALRSGRPAEALSGARALARSTPSDGRALAIWGMAAVDLGSYAEAIAPLKAAAALACDAATYAGVMVALARALSAAGAWAEAERAAFAAERAGLGAPRERRLLGGVLFRIGLVERAMPHFEAAVEADPGCAEYHRDLAIGLVGLGRLEEAEAALDRAVALDLRFGVAHMMLADLRTWTAETAHVDRLRALWRDPALPTAERAAIGFGLFKELDDLDLTEEAWPVLEEANRLAAAGQPAWSERAEAGWVEAMIAAFPTERFAQTAPAPPATGPRTVFIVGLPRSGTTLVERVLAAHSGVAAMGELVALPLQFKRLSGAPGALLLDDDVARRGGAIDWPSLAQAYRAETAYLWGSAGHVIDKQPRNSAYLGPIRLAFPDALIIHLRRDPMDGLFGAYKVMFSGAFEWSTRLEDLARHHQLHSRLMDHWRACLGAGLIEVDYETLVGDPEAQIRRLLDACGLVFEDACLRPEQAPGAVVTASSAQVRSPINARRVGAWRRYAGPLAPLRARLEAEGAL